MKMKRISFNILFITSLSMMLASCNKESFKETSVEDKYLAFDLSMAKATPDGGVQTTKSVEIRSDDGSISLPMECFVTDGIGTCAADTVLTRAAQKNSTADLQNIGSFKVTAFGSDKSKFVPTDGTAEGTVSYGSGKWTLDSKAPLWGSYEAKTFFAYTNNTSSSHVSCSKDGYQTFECEALETDASKEKDVLLGYYKGTGDSDGDGIGDGLAQIQFVHPMTAVVFERGEIEGVTAIKSISIEGVYAGGKVTVTYSYDTGGNLVPSFNWGTSLSGTTTVSQTVPNSGALPDKGKAIGVPFIIFPQDLSEKGVTVKAVVTTSYGDQNVKAELNTGKWQEGKTNTYTIGYDGHSYTYEFKFTDNTTSNTQSFSNTTATASSTVEIISDKVRDDSAKTGIDWVIKSVKVGDADEMEVNDVSFSNIGGLSAAKDGNSLKITAAEREDASKGTNNYWINKDGASGDTDGTGWSPTDWSETRATADSPLDLSMFDFQTEETTGTMNTANCYIIRHAGTYKIPLVYGNAIKNGSTNTQSYIPTMASGGEAACFLSPFRNHLGNGITNPFIENNTSCSAKSCDILWQDEAEVIKDLKITGTSASTGSYNTSNVRYLQFTVNQSDIRQNNALIAVKDTNGKIMWSWHIWTTNDPALISEPISVYNLDNVEYKFFGITHLGWIEPQLYPSRDDVTIILIQGSSGKTLKITVNQQEVSGLPNATLYQWGRKDPICGYDIPAKGSFTKNGGKGTSIAGAISNPDKMYVVQAPVDLKYTWNTDGTYLNTWTGKLCVRYKCNQNSNIIKTVYDPSPIGYHVPASAAFSAFTITGGLTYNQSEFNIYGGNNKGYYFYRRKNFQGNTIKFSGNRTRINTTGELTLAEYSANYWSCQKSTYNSNYLLYFGSGIDPYSENTDAYGFLVRPVKE